MADITPPQPLAAHHLREAFDCGRASMDQWFRRHALRNQESGASRINVICDPETGAIAGYVSLSAAQIEREYLLKKDQRNRPDPVPAILLGQLAVDRRYQGQGHARSLLYFALTTAVRLSDDIGCFCVLTHPLDDGVRAFYRQFGFADLPGDPHASMAVRIMDLKQSGF